MEKQVYKWQVKRGSILLFEEGHKIHIELDKEKGESCLLTKEDAEEVISIMTSLAKAIWESPDFVKEPYEGRQYKIDDSNGLIYWDLEQGRLSVGFNETEEAVEINYTGEAALKVSVNYAVEVIQVISHYYKQFRA